MINTDPIPGIGAPPPKNKLSPKELLWQTKLTEVRNFRDRAGQPVDKGIEDTVTVLNLLNFRTIYSCEGHVNNPGDLSPSIQIQQEKNPVEEALILNKQINKLIVDFYRQKVPDKDSFIRTRVINGIIFLDAGPDDDYEANLNKFIIGPDETTMKNVTPEEMNQRINILSDRQQEMREFTDYLKKIFFSKKDYYNRPK